MNNFTNCQITSLNVNGKGRVKTKTIYHGSHFELTKIQECILAILTPMALNQKSSPLAKISTKLFQQVKQFLI